MRTQLKNNKGQALILSYMVIASFLALTAGLLTKAISEKNMTERARLTTEALYLSEGATENAIKNFTSAIANFTIPPSTPTYTTATTFATFGNAVINTTITQIESSDRAIVDALGRNVYVRLYEAVSTAAHPENSSISVTTRQIFNRRLIPTFQHMIFYNDDLEILPGANMTLSGRIHSNSDIYIASRATLTVDSNYLHSAGNIYNRRKENPGDFMAGNVSIRVTKNGAPQYQDMAGLDSDASDWATESTDRWKGTVMSAVHDVHALTAPSVGTTQSGGYYNNQANTNGLVIRSNGAIYRNGVLVNPSSYPSGTVSFATTSFRNNRENTNIKMMTIDMAKLSGSSGTCSGTCQNNLPSNGLMYVEGDLSGQEPGVKLINGSSLPTISGSGGLTVATNAPMYLEGNYNTSNSKPASIIADSLNLLSENWKNAESGRSSDEKSQYDLSSRTATETTFNCAFVAGVDTSIVNGNYNGGLENYPRLHENWSGVNLNIVGSFVELWNSTVATGDWAYGNPQYTAPNRNWTYNTAFNNINGLPPFTPMAVEAERLAWRQD